MECGMPIGFRFFIARAKVARLDVLVAFELDLADLDLRTFLDDEGQATDAGGIGRTSVRIGRELVAVRGQQFLDDDFRALYLGRIVLAFLVRPTFISLNLSSTSLCDTELRPTYLISRIVGFSLT